MKERIGWGEKLKNGFLNIMDVLAPHIMNDIRARGYDGSTEIEKEENKGGYIAYPLFPSEEAKSEFFKIAKRMNENERKLKDSGIVKIFNKISEKKKFKFKDKEPGKIEWNNDRSIVSLIFDNTIYRATKEKIPPCYQKKIFAKIDDENIMIGYSTGEINSDGSDTFAHIPNNKKGLQKMIINRAKTVKSSRYN